MTRKEMEKEVKRQVERWEKEISKMKREKELKQKGKGWMITW